MPKTWQVKSSTNQRLAKFILFRIQNLASQTIYKPKTCQVYTLPHSKLGKSNHLQTKDLPSLYSSAFKLGKSNHLRIKDLPSLK